MAKGYDSSEMTNLILDAVAEASARTGKPEEKVDYADFSDEFKNAIKNQEAIDSDKYREAKESLYEGIKLRDKLLVPVALIAGIACLIIANGKGVYIVFGIGMILISIIGFIFNLSKNKD